jgi:hypothetical protein
VKKGINPLGVLVMIMCVILAFVIAGVVKGALPDSVEKYSNLIFWGVVIVVGGVGSLLSGKFFGRK